MQLLDGKKVSETLLSEIEKEVASLALTGKKKPHLAAIIVGDDPASATYVASKVKTCAAIGFDSTLLRLESETSEENLLGYIRTFNDDPEIDGILVQLPLPQHISETKVINTIRPDKDVDGFHPVNLGRMMQGQPAFISATPNGILLMLDYYQIPTSGKHCVVIGRSNIVGRPMSILMSRNEEPGNCTVTLCHSRTQNLKEICREADIIIAAIGKPNYVTEDMVREGALVIDVGINRVEDSSKKRGYRLVGDVDFEKVAPKCSFITPVPGGVGKMTICALMKNTLQAAAGK